MASVAALAADRQRRLIQVTDLARNRAIRSWHNIDFDNLDSSWASVGPTIVLQATAAQLELARGADRYTQQVSAAYDFHQDASAVIPEALSGVDGAGRDVNGILFGAVTTTKQATGSGLSRADALQAGATYLAAIMKTVVGDLGRASDLTAAAGNGYTHYIRVVSGKACSRCSILAGKSSAQHAFKRHVSCQCTAVAAPNDGEVAPGLHDSPSAHFDSLSAAEQDRVYTKAGAEAIRAGADPAQVVSARRGAKGIGYGAHDGTRATSAPRGHYVKTTIGYRPDGTPVQVYATEEGRTVRGQFGQAQKLTSSVRKQQGARYQSTSRVRLMPESIMEIAGNDTATRQAFLRDAGYLQSSKKTGAEIIAEQREDRILVDRATLRFGNFTLG